MRRSGSSVARVDDGSSVRRVVQCACGRSAHFVDPDGLWAKGWGSWWDLARPEPCRIWVCSDCWVRPTLGAQPLMVSPKVIEIARARRDNARRKKLELEIARLLEVDLPRARHALRAICLAVPGKSGEPWRDLLQKAQKAAARLAKGIKRRGRRAQEAA